MDDKIIDIATQKPLEQPTKKKSSKPIAEQKLTIKQEKFCRLYIELDGNASEAYRQAYDCSNMKEASIGRCAFALLSNLKITSCISDLRKASAVRHDITMEKIVAMLMEDRELARSVKQTAAAVTATMNLARLHGYLIERKEVGGAGAFADLDDNELQEYIKQTSNAAQVG